MNPFDFDDRVTAAIIAAVGTMVGALVQLRIAWRKEVADRARGAPVTKKSRRGPVLAVFVLLLGAGVGGFAFSRYLMAQSDHESALLRGELQTQLAQITATAERLERATLNDHGLLGHAEDGRHSTAATTTVGPCRLRALPSPDAARTCSEDDALRVTLCASVPSSAVVTEVVRYARLEDSQQPWTEHRVASGQDIGRARFADESFERAETDQTKQVCTGFSSWDGERPYSARIVVTYTPSTAARELSHTAVAPTALERLQ